MSRSILVISAALALAALACLAAPVQAQRGRGGFGGRGRVGVSRGFGGFRYSPAPIFRAGAPRYRAYYGYGLTGYTALIYGFGGYGFPGSGYGGYLPDDYYDLYVPPGDDLLPTPRPTEPPPPPDNTARIRVLLPPDAQLWFEDKLTAKRGEERIFFSPRLTPGRDYFYKIRARWRLGPRMVEQSGEFKVRANETTTVRFPLPVD
jgi:uncharacterized protein (TIGR03000 family)